jgi:hypothetical protein
MSNNNSSQSGGITIAGLLGVVFVTLKLIHQINWSWWWVTAPFWGGPALAAVIILVLVLVAGVGALLPKRSRRYSR